MTGWDVSGISDMTNAFKERLISRAPGLSTWDVNFAQQMDSMFEASGMNANISGWDVSNTLDMNRMFAGAVNFNQPINDWWTSEVEDMSRMFSGATSFNQDMHSWHVGNVTTMREMFAGSAITADREYGGWDISHVTDFTDMFSNNPGLTRPDSVGWYGRVLSGWATKVTTDSAVTLTVCGSAVATGGAWVTVRRSTQPVQSRTRD